MIWFYLFNLIQSTNYVIIKFSQSNSILLNLEGLARSFSYEKEGGDEPFAGLFDTSFSLWKSIDLRTIGRQGGDLWAHQDNDT